MDLWQVVQPWAQGGCGMAVWEVARGYPSGWASTSVGAFLAGGQSWVGTGRASAGCGLGLVGWGPRPPSLCIPVASWSFWDLKISKANPVFRAVTRCIYQGGRLQHNSIVCQLVVALLNVRV